MYRESGTLMRAELAALLRYPRVLPPLRGPDDALPQEELANRVEYILRFRQSLLTWCLQSAVTARPLAFSKMPPGGDPFAPGERERPPVIELIRQLELAVSASRARLPRLDELTTDSAADPTTGQPNEVVEHWRTAARAAALGEHDTGPDFEGRLSTPQAQALLGDVSLVTQALVVLDQRHRLLPGWQVLAGVRRLGWTALACAMDVGLGQPDYSVDQLGWRRKVKLIRHEVEPGILNVLKAEHNLLVRLDTFPTATNLRLVIDSQRVLSHELAGFADRVTPELAARWRRRSETYTLLQRQMRDLGGNIGRGGQAVAEGANAVGRLRNVPGDTVVEPRVLNGFQILFDRVDARIADILEDGVRRHALVQRVRLPRVVDKAHKLVQPVRERFVVVTESTDLPVLSTVRERLRPAGAHPSTARPDPSRAALSATIVREWPVERRQSPFEPRP